MPAVKVDFEGSVDAPGAYKIPPTAHLGTADYVVDAKVRAPDAWPDVPRRVRRIRLDKKESEYVYFEFSPALQLATPPGPYCIPQDLLSFKPPPEAIYKYFFKGTPREVAVRQIFFHTELESREKEWLKCLREYCKWKNYPLRTCVEPFLTRICLYNWRKHGDKGYLPKAYEHVVETVNWRGSFMPISDQEPDLKNDLKLGAMYWTGRDTLFRPLLMVRLRRLPKGISPLRFKRLTVFCFEWAIRHLFIPGIVETCTVVFDVRGIAIHNFPMSALSDMTNTLSRQYPFRLDRMFIINDSIFIQTVWSIAKQFLTEVQQQKMCFMRTGFEKELLKIYAPHHLEKDFGGTRPEVTSFYPFPLSPRPFNPNATAADPAAIPDCYKALSIVTTIGETWSDTDQQLPQLWSKDAPAVFARCNLPPPVRCENAKEDTQPVPSEAEVPLVTKATLQASASFELVPGETSTFPPNAIEVAAGKGFEKNGFPGVTAIAAASPISSRMPTSSPLSFESARAPMLEPQSLSAPPSRADDSAVAPSFMRSRELYLPGNFEDYDDIEAEHSSARKGFDSQQRRSAAAMTAGSDSRATLSSTTATSPSPLATSNREHNVDGRQSDDGPASGGEGTTPDGNHGNQSSFGSRRLDLLAPVFTDLTAPFSDSSLATDLAQGSVTQFNDDGIGVCREVSVQLEPTSNPPSVPAAPVGPDGIVSVAPVARSNANSDKQCFELVESPAGTGSTTSPLLGLQNRGLEGNDIDMGDSGSENGGSRKRGGGFWSRCFIRRLCPGVDSD